MVSLRGLGIRPFCPKVLAIGANFFIIAGVATATSKKQFPVSFISLIISSPPAIEAPSCKATFTSSPSAKTAMRKIFPVPYGKTQVPRTI